MSASDAAMRDLVIALRELVVASIRFRDRLAAESNIGQTETTALAYLRQAGELTPRELGALLGLTSGSVTGVVDRLESAGFAVRRPHPNDRRSLLVSATDAGVQAAERVFQRFDEALEEGLREADIDIPGLAAALNKTAASVRRHTPAGHDPIAALRARIG